MGLQSIGRQLQEQRAGDVTLVLSTLRSKRPTQRPGHNRPKAGSSHSNRNLALSTKPSRNQSRNHRLFPHTPKSLNRDITQRTKRPGGSRFRFVAKCRQQPMQVALI
jgi:hypothetical protein